MEFPTQEDGTVLMEMLPCLTCRKDKKWQKPENQNSMQTEKTKLLDKGDGSVLFTLLPYYYMFVSKE